MPDEPQPAEPQGLGQLQVFEVHAPQGGVGLDVDRHEDGERDHRHLHPLADAEPQHQQRDQRQGRDRPLDLHQAVEGVAAQLAQPRDQGDRHARQHPPDQPLPCPQRRDRQVRLQPPVADQLDSGGHRHPGRRQHPRINQPRRRSGGPEQQQQERPQQPAHADRLPRTQPPALATQRRGRDHGSERNISGQFLGKFQADASKRVHGQRLLQRRVRARLVEDGAGCLAPPPSARCAVCHLPRCASLAGEES